MARIAGVDLPRDKRVAIALTYIFGIGHTMASRIASQARIDSQTRINELSEDQVNSLRSIIEVSHKVEGSLRGETTMMSSPDGHRLLSGLAASPRAAGQWPAH